MSIHTASTHTQPVGLPALADQALAAAATALAEEPARALDAVAWASAHVAATERVLLPVARRHLRPSHRDLVDAVRRSGVRLAADLRRLEQRHAGDSLAANIDVHGLNAAVLERVTPHRALVAELMARLDEMMPAHEHPAVAAAYSHALAAAPTRPHPHVPHRGPLAAVAFRVDALRDRVLNTLDSRHVPTPHEHRPPRRAGKWSRYLMGG
jgi:hypothetical protein